MLTEQQNPKTLHMDSLSTLEVLQVINEEDQRVPLAVQRVIPAITEAVDSIVNAMQQGGRLFYMGAGTSGRLGVLDAVECVPTYGTSPELIQGIIAGGTPAMMHSVEDAEDNRELAIHDLQTRHLTAKDVVVGIAASGTTPYVISAVTYASSLGCVTVGVACNEPCPLLDAVKIRIPLLVGPEVITGSTRMKSGTAQKLALNMLSTAVMVKMGKVYGNLMVDVQITNKKLEDRAERIVMQLTGSERTIAHDLLQQSKGSAKVAIVMHHQGVSAEDAQRLLDAQGGHLRKVIG